MPQSEASIGIDWGTHSSKWTWTFGESRSAQFKILYSDVRLDEASNKILLSDERPPT